MNDKIKNAKRLFIFFSIIILLIAVDQIIKYFAVAKLKELGTVPLIKGFFSFSYVENTGAAWGIFAGNKLLLVGLTSVIIIFVLAYVIIKTPKSNLLLASLALILTGGIGNLIDRVFRGYVVDMFEFTFFTFPVFNFADFCVVIGTVIVMIFIIFLDEDVLARRNKKKLEKEKKNSFEEISHTKELSN